MKKLLSIALACAVVPAFAKVESHWDGGRNTPVHRLTLNDEFGDVIVPNAPNALPLSTRQTCGQCRLRHHRVWLAFQHVLHERGAWPSR